MTVRLEAARKAIGEFAMDSDCSELSAAKCEALIMGYDWRYRDDEWRALAVEKELIAPAVHPEGAPHYHDLVCYMDTEVTGYGHKRVNLEHKTCASDTYLGPTSPFWSRLDFNHQTSLTALLAAANGQPLDGCIQDVIRKPSGSRKKIPAGGRKVRGEVQLFGTVAEIKEAGQYWGYDGPDGSPLSEADILEDGTESPYLYRCRLAYDCIENPDKYYFRSDLIRRTAEELQDFYLREVWPVLRDIETARANAAWYQNDHECTRGHFTCDYMGVCRGFTEPVVGEIFDQSRSVDPEWRNRFSYSRLAAFKACRRKFQFRYEIGIKSRKADASYLEFGKMFHKALEAWWSCTKLPAAAESDDTEPSAKPTW